MRPVLYSRSPARSGIAHRWLDWQTVEPRVRAWQSLIAAEVKLDTRKLYSTDLKSFWTAGVTSF